MIRRVDVLIAGVAAVLAFWFFAVAGWPRHSEGMNAAILELALAQTARALGTIAALLGVIALFRSSGDDSVRRVLVAMIILMGGLLFLNPDWAHTLTFGFLGLILAAYDAYLSRRNNA